MVLTDDEEKDSHADTINSGGCETQVERLLSNESQQKNMLQFATERLTFLLLTSYISVNFCWVPKAWVFLTEEITSSARVPPSAVCSNINLRYSDMNLFIPHPATAMQGTVRIQKRQEREGGRSKGQNDELIVETTKASLQFRTKATTKPVTKVDRN